MKTATTPSFLPLLAALLCGGCASVPAAFRPIPPVSLSAAEVDRVFRAQALPLAITSDGTLRGRDGETVTGAERVRRYLTTFQRPGVPALAVTTTESYRCAPDAALQLGYYEAWEGPPGAEVWVSGPWRAEWSRQRGEWRISAAHLLVAGEVPDPPDPGCVGLTAERAATARFSASAHLNIMSARIGNPHDNLGAENRGEVANYGALGSLRLRAWRGLGLGGYYGYDPTFTTVLSSGVQVRSQLRFIAPVLTYEGRNVALDVGPAHVRSSWWRTNDNGVTGYGLESSSRWGAIASAHAFVPLHRQFAVDFLAQRRFFGEDSIPDFRDPRAGPQDSFYFALGVLVFPER